MVTLSGTDNITTALPDRDKRVCRVYLVLAGWQSEEVLTAMQVPFPKLKELWLIKFSDDDETVPVIPDSFLDGSAPRLRIFHLHGITFPGLPKLHLSATHLICLSLNIPHSGYISPEAIITLISALSSLRTLSLVFQSPQSRPDWETRSLPPPKRSILPALERFLFTGVTEYLEELVTPIDTPRLYQMDITFFNQIDFDCPRLAQFINRTPTLRAPDEAHMQFDDSIASVILRYQPHKFGFHHLLINISCREPDWQLTSIEQVCNSSLPPPFHGRGPLRPYGYSELVLEE